METEILERVWAAMKQVGSMKEREWGNWIQEVGEQVEADESSDYSSSDESTNEGEESEETEEEEEKATKKQRDKKPDLWKERVRRQTEGFV